MQEKERKDFFLLVCDDIFSVDDPAPHVSHGLLALTLLGVDFVYSFKDIHAGGGLVWFPVGLGYGM